jgi:hypothetical protein
MVHPLTQDDVQVPQEEACDQGGAHDVQDEEEEIESSLCPGTGSGCRLEGG